jgi:dihydroneopterin aldolase
VFTPQPIQQELSPFALDQIVIEGMEAMAFIGVPDEERAKAQKIEITLVLHKDIRRAGKSDHLNDTIDYALVHQKALRVVEQRPRKLIENLAEDLASVLMREFSLQRIDIKVTKFILENTKSVSVCIIREHSK